MATIRCSIVTPSASVFDADASYVSLPAWDGQMGVMPGASPMLVRLGIGRLAIDSAAGKSVYAVEGGFAQIADGVLTILTEQATVSNEVDRDAAKRMLTEANARAVAAGERDRAAVEAEQARARALLTVAS